MPPGGLPLPIAKRWLLEADKLKRKGKLQTRQTAAFVRLWNCGLVIHQFTVRSARSAGLAMIILALLAFLLWTPDKERPSLEAKYLRSPADMVNVAGQRLHMRDDGSRQAPALILLHGVGASLHTWEPWAQDLARDHRVIRFDLPGSGLSHADPQGIYTDARSMELLISLSLMKHVLPKALLLMSLEPAYADASLLTDELETRYHDLALAPGSRTALLERMAQARLVDPVSLLHQIRAPTLLLWGVHDAMIPFTNSADYLRALSGARLASVPGVGHLPHEEAPERSLALLRYFLKQP